MEKLLITNYNELYLNKDSIEFSNKKEFKTTSKHIDKIKDNIPEKLIYRTLRIYLPDSYSVLPEVSYPVLYIHDGQNVFMDESATFGHSWKVLNTLDHMFQLGQIPEIIVVAIDNGGPDRYMEYSPWTCELYKSDFDTDTVYGGEGCTYSIFISEYLKPLIDKRFRTKPSKENTFLAGSSMGGLISAYIGLEYPNVFSKIGIFSLASWFAENQFIDYVRTKQIPASSYFYLYVGTNESSDQKMPNMNQIYLDNTLCFHHMLLIKGAKISNLKLTIGCDQNHNEQTWSIYFPDFLKFIFNTAD